MGTYVVTIKKISKTGGVMNDYKAFTVTDQESAKKAAVDWMLMNEPETPFQIKKVEEFMSDGSKKGEVKSDKK